MSKFGWLALLVACGGSGSSAPDARDAPGAIDANDAASDVPADVIGCGQGAPVTATGPALPPGSTEQLTITAVSHDASGAYCARTTATGASAHLTIDVPPGGMLTLVAASDMREQHTVTWTGVKAGDDLIFPSLVRRVADEKQVQVQLTIPALAGATSYQFMVMCPSPEAPISGGAQAGALSTQVTCDSGAQSMAAWVMANTSQGVEFASGEVTSIASSGATVIPIGAWAPAATVTTTITGAGDFERADVGFAPGLPTAPSTVTQQQLSSLNAGAATVVTPLPAELAGEADYAVVTPRSGALVIHRPYAAPPGSADLAVGTDFLPVISASIDTGLPRPRMSWTAAAPLSGIDIALVRRDFWIVVTDGTNSSVQFPELPAELVPPDLSPIFDVDLIESPDLAGYDDARRDPLGAYLTHQHRITSAGWVNGGTF